MVTNAGTITRISLDCKLTTAPVDGAGPFSTMAPRRVALASQMSPESATAARAAGCTVTPALAAHCQAEAEITAWVLPATGDVEMVNATVDCPGWIRTCD